MQTGFGSALGFPQLTPTPDHSWKLTASDSGYAPRVAGGTFTAMTAKVEEQNLAVFGESGSGKTVLLSSFFGASQEPSFPAENLYKVLLTTPAKATACARTTCGCAARLKPRSPTASRRRPTASR
jgi:hypothetical protein